MRILNSSTIIEKVVPNIIQALYKLPQDVYEAINHSTTTEVKPSAKTILKQCIENADIASEGEYPICQDTGTAVFFVTLGNEIFIEGLTIPETLNEAVRVAYKEGYLRKSIVADPLFLRKNTLDNTPAIIHIEIVRGDTLTIDFAPKGGGSENMSAIAMLTPSDGVEGIFRFVTETVIKSGGNPCPPVIVGVGIGGNFEKSAILSKKALLRKLGSVNNDEKYRELENRILTEINLKGSGPQGLGGSTTALAVHILNHPVHLASMPVAVNLNCHVARHTTITI